MNKIITYLLTFDFILFSGNSIASEYENKFTVIDFYKSILGLEVEAVLDLYKTRVKVSKVTAHDPGTYERALRFTVDSKLHLFLHLKNDAYVDSISFDSYSFRTDLDISLGDGFCEVRKAYPNMRVVKGFDEYGDSIYLKEDGNPMAFRFGSPRDVDLQYYSPEEAMCNERLLSITLKK